MIFTSLDAVAPPSAEGAVLDVGEVATQVSLQVSSPDAATAQLEVSLDVVNWFYGPTAASNGGMVSMDIPFRWTRAKSLFPNPYPYTTPTFGPVTAKIAVPVKKDN